MDSSLLLSLRHSLSHSSSGDHEDGLLEDGGLEDGGLDDGDHDEDDLEEGGHNAVVIMMFPGVPQRLELVNTW